MNTGIDLPPRQPADAGFIKRPASREGSHERRAAACKRLTHVRLL
jgi:hypothetical protein